MLESVASGPRQAGLTSSPQPGHLCFAPNASLPRAPEQALSPGPPGPKETIRTRWSLGRLPPSFSWRENWIQLQFDHVTCCSMSHLVLAWISFGINIAQNHPPAGREPPTCWHMPSEAARRGEGGGRHCALFLGPTHLVSL